MASRRKYLIWDFDGTLGYRPGQWSGTMVQVARRFAGVEVDLETMRPFMRRDFPWHNPEVAHPPRRSAEEWWAALRPVFEKAFVACGVPQDTAGGLAGKVRSVYTDVTEWRLFEDTIEVLEGLREEGWSHAVLSNHVPELRALIEGLGVGALVDHVMNSAETGFEKPHPQAFRTVLAELRDPAEVWMIGDNIEADVLGAEAVGLRAILVRSEDSRAARRAASLREVRRFLG
jgi:putative hydrolase of the HAD superfamily